MQLFKKKQHGEDDVNATGDNPEGGGPAPDAKDKKKSKDKDKKEGDDSGNDTEKGKQQGWERFDTSKATDFQVTPLLRCFFYKLYLKEEEKQQHHYQQQE